MLEKIKQDQSNGDNSQNLQAAGDINLINIKEELYIKEQQLIVENNINVDSPDISSITMTNSIYEISINSIQNELLIISDILSAINIFFVFECIDKIRNIPIVNNVYDKAVVSKIFESIGVERQKIHSNNIRLNMHTSIYASCEICGNKEKCVKSTCRLSFMQAYNNLYKLMFDIFNCLHDYLKVIDTNLLKDAIILNTKRLADLSNIESEKTHYNNQASEKELEKTDTTEYIEQLNNVIDDLNLNGYEYMNTLILASKQYIYYQKEDAKKIKNNETPMNFIPLNEPK